MLRKLTLGVMAVGARALTVSPVAAAPAHLAPVALKRGFCSMVDDGPKSGHCKCKTKNRSPQTLFPPVAPAFAETSPIY